MKKNDALLLLIPVGLYLLSRRKAEAGSSLPPIQEPSKDPIVIRIDSSPIAGVAPVAVHFEASISNAVRPLTSIYWTFGDGDTSGVVNPSHEYKLAGNYKVALAVQDSEGRTGYGSTIVSVFAPRFVTPPPVSVSPDQPAPTYATPTLEEIPAVSWQSAPEYSEGQVAYTTAAPPDIQVGGTASDGAPLTYYYIDGKLVAVRQ